MRIQTRNYESSPNKHKHCFIKLLFQFYIIILVLWPKKYKKHRTVLDWFPAVCTDVCEHVDGGGGRGHGGK